MKYLSIPTIWQKSPKILCVLFLFFPGLVSCVSHTKEKETRLPNIIFVMTDDLGYGDLGCYGQEIIKTPHIDKMASEGMRFTRCYSGSPVCAPARSTLMTGLHTGHTTVRGNLSQVPTAYANPYRIPLNAQDVTVAEVLKKAGYVTGMFGKWGLGECGTSGEPNDQGFDDWFGYLNQKRAHSHFPDFLWHNKDTVWLETHKGQNHATFSHDLFTERALDFINRNRDTTFFLYMPYTLPHAEFSIPKKDYQQFMDKNWSMKEKVLAGMVERIDADMGRLFNRLKELKLDSNTIVFFCSDNGAAERFDGLFNSSGPLKGRKRDVYEGGIRVPMIVRMPGLVPANKVCDYPWYFPDVLPTLADLARVGVPENLDGISIAPLLRGENMTPHNRFMYWEFHEGSFAQAVQWNNWKAVRFGSSDTLELYDLSRDEAETSNLADQHPQVVEMILDYLRLARTESKYWSPAYQHP